MAAVDIGAIHDLLTLGPFRNLVAGKQVTLAFGGLYIAGTSLKNKARLVWEAEKGYPRYYVPVNSLHPDVRSRLHNASNGHSEQTGKKISISTIEHVKAKSGDNDAVVERVTVGSKSTTWVRFLEGSLKDLVRYESKDLDAWFEDGAIAAAIKNPYKRIDTKTVPAQITVKVDGHVVAETKAAIVLHETGLDEAYYIPATSIKDWSAVEKTDLKTACPYKGEAWYLSLAVAGKKWDNLIWYYQYPTHESASLEGLISFYNKSGVDILVDGLKV